MKQFLLFSLIFISISLAAQSDTISKGDWFIGANSNFAGTSFDALSINPTIGYQINNEWQVGGQINYHSNGYDYTSIYLRYYPSKCILKPTVKSFIQVSANTSWDDNSIGASAETGITGVLNKTFYIEPKIGFSYQQYAVNDQWGFQSSIGFGLRF